MTDQPIHIHTSTCYETTHEQACYEYRILELENILLKIQVGLRAVGANLDKMETSVTMELKHTSLKEV